MPTVMRQFPGAVSGRLPQASLRPGKVTPPWEGKQVVVPEGYSADQIEWVSIDQISPCKDRQATRGKQMIKPGETYPALVLGRSNIIADGHHRHYRLLDAGWRGRVPVVRQRRKEVTEAV